MRPDLSDLLVITGAAVSLAGFFMLAPWAALAALGVILLVIGLLRSR